MGSNSNIIGLIQINLGTFSRFGHVSDTFRTRFRHCLAFEGDGLETCHGGFERHQESAVGGVGHGRGGSLQLEDGMISP